MWDKGNSLLESARNKEPKTELLGTVTLHREVRKRDKRSDWRRSKQVVQCITQAGIDIYICADS